MNVTAPDLTTGFPRSGREMLGRYAWLARLADKVRADHAGTAGEYVAFCGLSMGFLDRAGVSKTTFGGLIHAGTTDADLVTYFDQHVDDAHREAANAYVLHDQRAHLDSQDAEEGRSAPAGSATGRSGAARSVGARNEALRARLR